MPAPDQHSAPPPDFAVDGACSVCGDPWPHRDADWAAECEEIAADAR